MTNNMMAAVYCRLARKDDAGIETQKKQVLQYAAKHGYNNIALYVDNGANGNDFNRPAFTEMNADIAAGKVSLVIVRSIDRIGRGDGAVGYRMAMTKRKGVAVKAMYGSCDDLNDSVTELIRNINAVYEINEI